MNWKMLLIGASRPAPDVIRIFYIENNIYMNEMNQTKRTKYVLTCFLLALLESGTRFKPVKDLYFGDTNEVRCRRRAKRL